MGEKKRFHGECYNCGETKELCPECRLCTRCALEAVVEADGYCPECLGYVLVATFNRETDLEKERDRLREMLAEMLRALGQYGPSPPQHECGHPDSVCDCDCAEYALYNELRHKARKLIQEREEVGEK
jgi:hypothetical protein